MENASKALIMAGGVLISLLVIGLLVMFFNNLSDLQNVKQTGEEVQKAVEFNKQYDVYERNIYGSELLSIANKINDYNKRESDNKGYTKIELEVEITYDMNEDYFNKGIYTASTIELEVDKLDAKVKEIGNTYIKNSSNKKISVSKLASMRTKDIEELGFVRTDYSEEVAIYNTYKNLLTEVKAKVFKCLDFKYDQYTGRITKMKYKI